MSLTEKIGNLLNFANPIITLPEFSEISLTQVNQRVIRQDCERTRSTLELFRHEKVRNAMEYILTHYCESEHVKYKQGMNEVLAPFVYLKLTGEVSDWSVVYTMFKRFIDKFLPFNFSDDEFEFLQKSCVCFRTLLRYHAPSLASKLDNAGILPELYVTPWFLTLFASKLKLPVVFELWEKYAKTNDTTFFAFIALSLMLGSVEDLETSEKIELPEKLTKLTFSEESLAQIWRRAEVLKSHTPQDLISLLSFSDRSTLVPQLPKKIVPMYVGVAEVFGGKDENKRFLILDTRPSAVVMKYRCGHLPNNISVPFDLEAITNGRDKFPVCEVYKKLAGIFKVDISGSAPFWPLQTHICILTDENRRLVKRDYSNMLYLCLTRYCNVPRVSLIRGGFEAVHTLCCGRLRNHDLKICCFCTGKFLMHSSDSSESSDSD